MAVNTVLPGYPSQIANKQFEVVDHAGPASYLAGGQTINASDFGWGGFDAIIGSMDQSKTYVVQAVYANTGGAMSTIKLQWFTLAGTEVADAVDLHLKIVRLTLIGV